MCRPQPRRRPAAIALLTITRHRSMVESKPRNIPHPTRCGRSRFGHWLPRNPGQCALPVTPGRRQMPTIVGSLSEQCVRRVAIPCEVSPLLALNAYAWLGLSEIQPAMRVEQSLTPKLVCESGEKQSEKTLNQSLFPPHGIRHEKNGLSEALKVDASGCMCCKLQQLLQPATSELPKTPSCGLRSIIQASCVPNGPHSEKLQITWGIRGRPQIAVVR